LWISGYINIVTIILNHIVYQPHELFLVAHKWTQRETELRNKTVQEESLTD